MKTSASNRRLRVILTALSDGTLDPRPEFQRRLVWSNRDKVQFIETVLQGYPFPEIYIAAGTVDPDTGKGQEMLVDGQQRMTSLHQYFQGSADLQLGSIIPPYKALDKNQKIDFLEYEVVVRDLGKLEIDEIKTIFEKINSTSYGLNAMEVRNARYAGAFKDFCETLATNPFFEKYRVFSASEVRRMQDIRYCLVLVATLLSTYFNRDNDIEIFLTKYSEEFPRANEISDLINSNLSMIESLGFPNDSRLFKKADLFTLVIELSKLPDPVKKKLHPPRIAKALGDFFSTVDAGPESQNYKGDVASYHKAALQATNDRENRITRGEIISELLIKTVQ